MSNTKNLGQVSGLFIGLSAPENTTLLWYDSTPNQQCHKVYDVAKKMWVALNPQIVAKTTYSELVNNAKKNGLAIGKFYQITDKSNTLAIAIASTKVQYVDSIGNLLIDDLGTNVQYHVSSDNLLIDDLGGVLDKTANKLIFQFSDLTPNNSTDYLLGKARSGNKWVLAKFSISKFLSTVSGNSLTWNNGLFFNFKYAIASILDKEGGVISKEVYDKNISSIQNSLNSISKENQTIIQNANAAIKDGTSDDAIFGKKNTKDIDTVTAPGDVIKGDTLFTIISKFQRWINRLKYATGVHLSRSFADAKKQQYINNNDTVESALGKVQYMLKNPIDSYSLPEGWTDSYPVDENGIFTDWETGYLPKAGDSFNTAFRKLSNFLRYCNYTVKLSLKFKPKDYKTSVELPSADDSFEEAFAKAVAKFNQIGDISDGKISSKQRSTTSSNKPVTVLDLRNGSLEFNSGDNSMSLSKSSISLKDSDRVFFLLNDSKFEYTINTTSILKNNIHSAAVIETTENYDGQSCAFQAVNSGNGRQSFDAFFQRLKVGGIVWGAYFMSGTTYSVTTKNFIIFNGTQPGDIYLPSRPDNGRFVIIAKSVKTNLNVHASGNDEIDTVNESSQSVSMGNNTNRGVMFAFIYIEGIRYDNKPNCTGLWQCARWEAAWG